MYATEKRVELVKRKIREKRRRQERCVVFSLSALCALLFSFLAGIVGSVRGQPMDAAGMYGAILLHKDAGGYVLVAVISFAAAVVITVLCIKLRGREHLGQDTEKENASQ